jgi:hypothetical protein
LTKNKNELIDCHEDEYQCRFEYHDLWLKFYSELENISDNYKPHYVGSGKLRVRAEQPFDSDFAFRVVERIRGLFSFIYSRKDISIGKVKLISPHEYLRPKQIGHKNDIYDNETHTLSIVSTLYLQEPYNSSIAEIGSFDPFKDVCFCMLKDNIGQLISMAFEDKIMFYDLTKAEKNAYDLKHALWVNFCFERNFIEIAKRINDKIVISFMNNRDEIDSTNKKVCKLADLRNKLLYVFNPNKLIGKSDKGLNPKCGRNVVIREINVQDNNANSLRWKGLESKLTPYCDVCGISFEELIGFYIDYRNAHAHGAKAYNLKLKNPLYIIYSIRLVECINYCLILKMAGYSDEKIADIIDNFWSRQLPGLSEK